MRPGTILEKRVESLAGSLKGLTSSQEKWGLDHVIPHYCIYRTRIHRATCIDCGHTWFGKKPTRCPQCGAKLTVKEDTRQSRFIDRCYYGILQRCQEFNVFRLYYCYSNKKKGEPSATKYMVEVTQHWIGDDGQDTIRALRLTMFPYYRYCPFSLDSDLTLKRDCDNYGYYNTFYHIMPHRVYPRTSCTAMLKRNGFKGRFRGLPPERVIQGLLTDNRFETLWKNRMNDFCEEYQHNGKQHIRKYWKQVLDYHHYGYKAGNLNIWFDYLDLLEYFQKDLRSPHYLFPEFLGKEHDRLVQKKTAILERQELERRKQQDQDKLAVLAGKAKYFDITFSNDLFCVVVLKSLEEYKAEGDYQHHCVYTNSYYGKKDTLVLSARMKDSPDRPVETIEISLIDGRILQCYGKYNQPTQYHQDIIDLVNHNSKRFLTHGTFKQS